MGYTTNYYQKFGICAMVKFDGRWLMVMKVRTSYWNMGWYLDTWSGHVGNIYGIWHMNPISNSSWHPKYVILQHIPWYFHDVSIKYATFLVGSMAGPIGPWLEVLLSLSLDATGRTPHWLDPLELGDGKGTLEALEIRNLWIFIRKSGAGFHWFPVILDRKVTS